MKPGSNVALDPDGLAGWKLQLFGGFCLHDGASTRHTRLHSRHVVALLARLAIFPRRDHAREELIDVLWPEVDAASGRNRLRNALSMLRTVLEPPGGRPGRAIDADRTSVRLVPGTLACDVIAFERCAAAGDARGAVALYRGELLPGHYSEWIDAERLRLAALHEHCARAAGPPVAFVHEASVAEAPPERGPAPTPSVRVVGLPGGLTRLFGAAAQLEGVGAAVRVERLVVLLGPGGCGKSRLAIGVAEQLARGGADPPFTLIVRVAMVDASHRQQALDAIGRALGMDRAEATVEALAARLDGQRTLLLLDNLEQLVGRGAEIVGELAAALPRLHLLVTSRRALAQDGAHEWVLPPLDLPEAGCSLAEAAANPAVGLFVDRAVAVRQSFRLGARNLAAVVGVVRVLDGLPLAIELAAARSRSHSPAELLERLRRDARSPDDAEPMLDLLARAGPRSGHDSRHATMTRTIGWSWGLLDAAEQRLAEAIAVFRGGCAAPMLQAVLGASVDAGLALDALLQHHIVGARPLSADADDDRPLRVVFHEPVRRFVARQMSPADAAHWRARHRRWAIGWLQALPPTWPLAVVREELPNLSAAFESAAADAQGDDAARLLVALQPATEVVSWPIEVLHSCRDALGHCTDPALRSRAEATLALLFYFVGGAQDEAACRAEAALAWAPAGSVARGHALYPVAVLLWRKGRSAEDVLPLVDEARTLAPDETHLQARFDTLQAFLVLRGAAAAALVLHERSLARRRVLGNLHALHAGHYNIAHVHGQQRRWDEALAGFRAVAAAAASVGDAKLQSRALDAAGEILTELRRFDEAIDVLRDSVRLSWRHFHQHGLLFNLFNLARPLARTRRPEPALVLAAFSAAFWRATIGEPTERDRHELRRVRRLCAVQLPGKACAAAWARGEALALVDAVALALETAGQRTHETT